MADQADGLRQLMQARSDPVAVAEPGCGVAEAARARSLVFTSGKGGVGTSNLALNLAIALGELGQRVVLVDGDLGLANIDLLCGLVPAHDLGDVLAGTCELQDVLVDGPSGIRIVPGAHGMRTLVELLGEGPDRLAVELTELEASSDFVLVDAGSGLSPSIARLAGAADQAVIVTTPEPPSVADAHAVIQRLGRAAEPLMLRALVNEANSVTEARDVLARLTASSREFLGIVVKPLGSVRIDPRVGRAVRRRRPFVEAYPKSVASRCVRRLARTLVEERQPWRPRRHGFFAALAGPWARRFGAG